MAASKTLLLPRFTINAFKNILYPRTLSVNYVQTESISNKISEKLGLPEKPRKPLSPYFRFIAKERPALSKVYTGHPQNLLRVIAEKWKATDEQTKNELRSQYNLEMVDYVKNIIKYEKSLTSEQKELLKNYKKEKKIIDDKREHRKKQRSLNKPKRPANPFLRFMSEKNALRDPKEDHMEFRRKAVGMWKSMSEEEKAKYKKLFDAEMEEFKKEIIKWEAEMIRSGNNDLIRTKSLVEKQKANKNHKDEDF